MLEVRQLEFKYDNSETTLKFPDFSLSSNENLAILGKSGVGKTTLLHLIAGILTPKGGSISIQNQSIFKLKHKALEKFRAQKIGLLFQDSHAIKSLNVTENLQARIMFSPCKVSKSNIEALLKKLNLDNVKNQNVKHLSKGQLQRLGVALSIIHKPKIILADEPTSNLDDTNCENVITLLKEQAKQNQANLIVITHDNRVKKYFENTLEL